MAKYRIIEPENKDKYLQLARIAFNLRHYSKIWKDHYGAQNRLNMALWEGKMDEFIIKNIEPDADPENKEELVTMNEKWQTAD